MVSYWQQSVAHTARSSKLCRSRLLEASRMQHKGLGEELWRRTARQSGNTSSSAECHVSMACGSYRHTCAPHATAKPDDPRGRPSGISASRCQKSNKARMKCALWRPHPLLECCALARCSNVHKTADEITHLPADTDIKNDRKWHNYSDAKK